MTLVYFGLILIGFCIYGPVALVTVQALNLVPKNAGWNATFVLLSAASVVAMLLCALTLKSEK